MLRASRPAPRSGVAMRKQKRGRDKILAFQTFRDHRPNALCNSLPPAPKIYSAAVRTLHWRGRTSIYRRPALLFVRENFGFKTVSAVIASKTNRFTHRKSPPAQQTPPTTSRLLGLATALPSRCASCRCAQGIVHNRQLRSGTTHSTCLGLPDLEMNS